MIRPLLTVPAPPPTAADGAAQYGVLPAPALVSMLPAVPAVILAHVVVVLAYIMSPTTKGLWIPVPP